MKKGRLRRIAGVLCLAVLFGGAAAARAEQTRLEALQHEDDEKKKKEEVERLAFEAKLDRDARYAARKERKKKRLSAFERFGLK